MASVNYDQIRADEEYARNLQQEEARGLLRNEINPQQDGAPVPQQEDQRARAVHANVQANIDDVREQSPRLLCMYLTWAFLEITTTAILLGYAWGKECDRPLKWFIAIFTARFGLLVPLRVFVYVKRRGGQQSSADVGRRLITWLDFVTFAWFIVGQTWLYGSETCSSTNPPVFYYSMVLIIVIYISMALPILILLGLCICLPCVLLVLRVVAEPRGAPDAEINKLPIRTWDDESERAARARESPLDPCSICRSDYAVGDQLRTLPCGHEFHVDCVDPWLKINQTCPLCRADIRSQNRPGQNNNNNNNDAQDQV